MPPSMIPSMGSGVTYSMGARNGGRELTPVIDHADGGTLSAQTWKPEVGNCLTLRWGIISR